MALAAKPNYRVDSICSLFVCLQHPFISTVSSTKPLKDLYNLVKAEVVETLEDLPEDVPVSYLYYYRRLGRIAINLDMNEDVNGNIEVLAKHCITFDNIYLFFSEC